MIIISSQIRNQLKRKLFHLRLGQQTVVRSDIKGRLLTPEEGCGQSNVPYDIRIVGGSPAINGKAKHDE